MTPLKSEIIRCAKLAGAHYNIPWQILAAQAAQESGYGQFQAAPNNVIGMKWTPGQWKMSGPLYVTKEFQGTGKEIRIETQFASFPSIEACMIYLAETLRFSSHYGSFRLVLDAQGATEAALRTLAATYCTDPNYAKALAGHIKVLEGSDVA